MSADPTIAAITARAPAPLATRPLSRAPISVLYGGAHLFNDKTLAKLGAVALRTLDRLAPELGAFAALVGLETHTPALQEAVYLRVREKLRSAPIEDFRIDFEDGYGIRSGAEEDAHAASAAAALRGAIPAFIGVRIKAMHARAAERAARTLDAFLTPLRGMRLTVTLPKVNALAEVECFAALVDHCARKHEVQLDTELMIESKAALLHLPELCAAAGPRLTSVHFGAYDFLSELGVAADMQTLSHPLCDMARAHLQLRAPVRVSDGATHLLPIGDDPARVAAHMRLHAAHVRHALNTGISQGWDLHPAQLVARYAAVYAFYLGNKDTAGKRLQRFVSDAAKARVEGGIFDDAATALGLLNFFARGYESGALSSSDLAAAGLDPHTLASRQFETLVT